MGEQSGSQEPEYFLQAPNSSTAKVIRRRVESPFEDRVWGTFISGDFVVYRPEQPNLFLPGKLLAGQKIRVWPDQHSEIYVGDDFMSRYGSVALDLPDSRLVPVPSEDLVDFLSLLGVEKDVARNYERRLVEADIDRFQFYALPRSSVDTHHGPFLRKLRIIGLDHKYRNRGGIAADCSPLITREDKPIKRPA